MANPTVLVTGGAKRIGKAIVEHFSRNGYSVIIHVSTSLEEGNHLAEEMRASGAKADVLQADLTDEGATEMLVELVENHPFVKDRGNNFIFPVKINTTKIFPSIVKMFTNTMVLKFMQYIRTCKTIQVRCSASMCQTARCYFN